MWNNFANYLLFVKLQVKFGLSYNSTEEAYRKGLFAKTHEMIVKHNSDPNVTYLMGHNQFSTMVQYRWPIRSIKCVVLLFKKGDNIFIYKQNEAEKKAYLCCHNKQAAATELTSSD